MGTGNEKKEAPHVTKLSHGLANKKTVLTVWDRTEGEVFSVPRGVPEEELDEFFLCLKRRMLK